MKLHHLKGRTREGYTTFGCVWEKGEVREPEFVLRDEQGAVLPVQSKVLAWWPDKSVKWSSHTADAGRMPEKVEIVSAPAGETDASDENLQVPETGIPNMNLQIPEAGIPSETLRSMGAGSAGTTLRITENDEEYRIHTGRLQMRVKKAAGGEALAEDIQAGGSLIAEKIYPVFVMEHREEKEHMVTVTDQEFRGKLLSVELEERGPLQGVLCFRGEHVRKQPSGAVMPFVIRMYFWAGSEELRFQHTFLYDGVEAEDFLKGMGIRFELCTQGKLYDRHVQFATDKAHFHEAAVILSSSHPKVGGEILQRQLDGEFVEYDGESAAERASADLPVWNDFHLCQDSAYHYEIRKRTGKECCEISCLQGRRAPGVMAVHGRNGGVMLGIRDFWQKYPAGLEVEGLGTEHAGAVVWFYSPEAKSFDFRHYAVKSYPRTCYEGFDYVGASAYGIGVTSECRVRFTERFAGREELAAFADMVQKPPVYAGDPEYYHEKRAFGFWSLPAKGTEVECWLEEQLERSFSFYQEEIEARDWYGLFDYGDVMHTYDAVRHVWKYDIGGMAWQNTELVPTYWLWLYFMRTGREDVFSLAEAMSRHCSEVDVYHFGSLKGLGSRHNVRHWGCSCKEPRISMAGHHRFLYYLTGDARLKDIFEEVKDSDRAMVAREKDKNPKYAGEEDFVPGIRSGPDWSSFVSNWMTWYEQTLDRSYRKRIETGISDIAGTPYGFASGPDYGYDLENAHLIYQGEVENTPNQHLQICMGGPQIWWETADMLEDDRLNRMLADLGAFYYLDKEEKARRTEGRIKERPFSWPMFMTGVSGYSAARRKDGALAEESWEILLRDLWMKGGRDGYAGRIYARGADGKEYREIPWNTTNTAAQWGLNVIMCMEFIREYLPESMEELTRRLSGSE